MHETMNIPNIDLPRVVILGGGFAGLKLARKLSSKYVQTVLIDENNYHTFQPLLYQVATAGLEPDSIAYPLRKILSNRKRTHIRLAKVQFVNTKDQVVETSIGNIHFDYLVVATGSKTNYFGNKNIEKYAMPMKSLTESLDLRSLILQNFEAALNENDMARRDSLMNFVVVGGGPTGVELAGSLAELRKHILPKDFPDLDIRRMQINLIEAGPKLLGAMSYNASDNSLDYLRSMDINVWLNTMVEDYDGEQLVTSQNKFETRNLIWAAGVTGNIPYGISEKHLDKGRITVNEYGQLEGYDNVFAIGDVASMQSEENPEGHPMLGAVAQQQGVYLAKYINRTAAGKKFKPFRYKDKGTMATIGRNLAVVDLGKLKFGGFFAWITWVFVHLMLLVDFRNRLIVLFNWVWSYINFDRGTRLIIRKFEKKLPVKIPRDSNKNEQIEEVSELDEVLV